MPVSHQKHLVSPLPVQPPLRYVRTYVVVVKVFYRHLPHSPHHLANSPVSRASARQSLHPRLSPSPRPPRQHLLLHQSSLRPSLPPRPSPSLQPHLNHLSLEAHLYRLQRLRPQRRLRLSLARPQNPLSLQHWPTIRERSITTRLFAVLTSPSSQLSRKLLSRTLSWMLRIY